MTLQGTNTYLLGTGLRRILIDTGQGLPVWTARLRRILQQEGATVEMVLISHWHPDHIGGVEELLAVAPDAVVYKHDPWPGQRPISDGQQFTTQGATLTAAHTPGHTQDHMVFILEDEDAMFTADNLLGHGTTVFDDLSLYMASLAKMCTLFSGRAYPGHGAVIESGLAKIVEYIAHRRHREEQVLQVIRGDANRAWRAMDVVRAVYYDVPQELHAAACGGVLQVLAKLQGEGWVKSDGDGGWRLMPSGT
ncbi:hypothetical protein CDD81_6030 [Ophiocordyceps australis]|uniref:Metallo-beta-lactamase domain-containing protein n=1 Tax=Ophiocordyceps australis TaxID=1399860 RepID=A0A2C5XDD1_9HYPO|nr:hypothetical protein CDD81_6030 [Ophiocordyceps australis]